MSNYGFEDEDDFVPPRLPKRQNRAPKSAIQTAVKAGNDMGFVPRESATRKAVEVKDRRSINREPQGKILITGPERVLEKLRKISIDTNEPYWRVLEKLIKS